MSKLIYHQAIKDLARAGHGNGRLAAALHTIRLDNALCGDRIDLDVALCGDRLAELAHITKGCLICRAAASLLALRAPGLRIAEVAELVAALRSMLESETAAPALWPELAAFVALRDHRSRHGCVLLPFAALEAIAVRLGPR
jgi:nitrogen fixation NifU-like protein